MAKSGGFAAVILAAGFSSRMGEFKPLLKLGPYTAIEHAVRCFFRAGIRDVRVVAGHRAEAVMEAVKPMGVRVVLNSRFGEGMYSSVQAGVGTLGPEARAFFLLPADHPLVRTSTIETILDSYCSGRKGIIYPTFQGRRGHPPLISKVYADEILKGPSPGGLRGLLSKYEHDALDVAVADEAVLLDMDVPPDYQYLLEYMGRRAVPTMDECHSFLREAGVDEPVWEHCHRVADLALELVQSLNQAGAGLDEELVLAGALLHDVARRQPDHARAGARFIQDRGYPRVADLVAVHMDIEVAEDKPLSEPEVVFLADKMVKGRSIVSVSDRLADVLKKYENDRQARQAAEQRLKQAERIKEKVEKILGRPVDTVGPADWEESDNSDAREVVLNA